MTSQANTVTIILPDSEIVCAAEYRIALTLTTEARGWFPRSRKADEIRAIEMGAGCENRRDAKVFTSVKTAQRVCRQLNERFPAMRAEVVTSAGAALWNGGI